MAADIASYTFPYFARKRDADKPNVLILFTDEQRFDTISALGHRHMITPTLDRLVREGCSFVNACTPNPVCVPARHSLITGLYSRDHGMASNGAAVVPPAMPRLPQILADNGYNCEVVGKMHFKPARSHHGFHRMQLQEELTRDVADDEYMMYLQRVGLGHIRNPQGIRDPIYHHPQRSALPEEHHPSTWVGDVAADAVRRNATRPFFLFASWIHPHPPVAVPDSFADIYRGRSLPVPTPREADPNPRLKSARSEKDFRSPEDVMRFRELYYSCITLVDKNMAKVLAALEEIGQLDNTLIIMTSDHGDMLGDNGAFDKSLPNDQAVRIPMIIRYPRAFKCGSVYNSFTDLVDLLPTVLDACGVGLPEGWDLPGESLLIPEGAGRKDRSEHYAENGRGHGRFISLRGRRYKYNYWFNGPREEFYDLQTDPAETKNLLPDNLDAQAKQACESMKAQLVEYEKRYGHRDSIIDGRLAVHKGPEGETWPPCLDGIDWQMAFHTFNMPAAEEAKLNRHGDEFLAAVAKEPTVDLKKINWEFYESSTRDLETRKKVFGLK
ncbi:MAG: sulfatase-like hydrolase/transferase [Planctomycetes bacterium]|nr:sulfatase-like hydrolase/transferase [Planctomycetota bacterium]